jgi:hypothetical protein
MFIARFCSVLLPLVMLPSLGAAADKPAYKRWYHFQYTLRSAALMDVTQRIETEVTSASLVQSLGQHRISNNDHFFDLDIVEAATIKPDGRRIEVPRSQIAVLSGAETGTNVLFHADVKTRVVPFPELAAGDRTLLVVKTSQKEPQGLGGNAIVLAFPPSQYFTGVKISVNTATDLPLLISERGLQHVTEQARGRKTLRWTVDEQPYAPVEANSTAPVDWAPTLMVSTYKSWEQIGSAEYKFAEPKSKPDGAINTLANDITKGISDRRAQAAAIFNWVASNIRYYEIVLNQGGWLPHDAGEILKTKYGDCKDHATLMRALLRAKGIESEYVLINALSKIYRAFDIPITTFDHMILYLPEFGVYADPTVATASFGTLPATEYDRPVLRLGVNGVTWTRTPAVTADDLRMELAVDAAIAADGQVTGSNVLRASGPLAIEARNVMRLIEQRGSAAVGKEALTKLGWSGTASFDVHSPFERGDSYEIASHFNLTTKMFGDGIKPAAVPTGPRAVVRPVGSFSTVVRENRQQDYFCLPLTYSETNRLKLPEGKKLATLPKGESVSHPLGEYQSTYRMDGEVLVVLRKIIWRVPGSVCTRKMADDLSAVWQAIERDTNFRLSFANIVENGAALVAPTDGVSAPDDAN